MDLRKHKNLNTSQMDHAYILIEFFKLLRMKSTFQTCQKLFRYDGGRRKVAAETFFAYSVEKVTTMEVFIPVLILFLFMGCSWSKSPVEDQRLTLKGKIEAFISR